MEIVEKSDLPATSEDLRAVFELCEPNSEGLISLRKLQELFQQHSSATNVRILIAFLLFSVL